MKRAIDWEDQRAFLAVLEEGSLSAAARRLGVGQPTMRTRIEALEHGLGTILFTRSVRGLVPTEQARALRDPVRAMARASEFFVRSASALPAEASGIVRISVSEVVGIEVLPPMLASLRERYPNMILELVLSNTSANLLEQEVDLAVRMTPPRQNGLTFKQVAAIPIGLFAHTDYLARRGQPSTFQDLEQHDLIGSDRSPPDFVLANDLHPGFDKCRFVIKTDSHPAQLAAARAGLGIATVQQPIGLADPQLQAVLPTIVNGNINTWIVTHDNLHQLPRIRVVFDHLVEQFNIFAQSVG